MHVFFIRAVRLSLPAVMIVGGLLTGISESSAVEKIYSRPLRYGVKRKPKPVVVTEAVTTPEVVAVEAPPPPPPAAVEGSAEATLAATSGNTRTSNFGLALDLAYRPKPWSTQFKANYLSSSNGGTLTSERVSLQGRGSRTFNERRDVFIDVYYLMNRFAGINSQFIPELGYGYEWFMAESLRLRTEASLGYTMQSQTDGTSRTFPSSRLGFLFAWKVSETTDFAHETSYFQNLELGTDYRIRSETSMTTQVTRRVAMKASYLYEFFNTPISGTAQDNGTIKSSLLLKF